jgi:hypothetical protein
LRSREGRLDRALFGALALHAGALAFLLARATRDARLGGSTASEAASEEPATIDIEPLAREPDEIANDTRSTVTGGAAPAGAARAASIGLRRGDGAEGAPPAERGPATEPNGSWSFSPLAPESIGIGGANRFLTAPAPLAAQEADPAKVAVEEALRAPQRARDRELGLGTEGPLLHALEESASAGEADVNGKALFEAVLDRDGALVGLSVLQVDGAIGPWRRIAEAARTAVGTKRVRAAGGSGVVARIEVESRVALPSGHDPGIDVSVLRVPVQKGEGPRSSKLTLLDPIPKIGCTKLTVGSGSEICIPAITVTLIDTNIDPTDPGAKARRVVHARVVDERPL